MKGKIVVVLLVAVLSAHTAQSQSLDGGVGNCFPPIEPFPYKLSKSDPLYNAARDEHQKYLEDIENYVNCLSQERSSALAIFKKSFRTFQDNFGKDAVFRYSNDRKDR